MNGERAPGTDLPPEDQRCEGCGGEGWAWRPRSVPAELSAWQPCHCNRTGLRSWGDPPPRRPKPTIPPEYANVERAAFLLDQFPDWGGRVRVNVPRPDNWREIGFYFQFGDGLRLLIRPIRMTVEFHVSGQTSEVMPVDTSADDLAKRARSLVQAVPPVTP